MPSHKSGQAKQKRGFLQTAKRTGKKVFNKSINLFKDQDIYGYPVTLNYQGDDSFKTCPGGILSLFVICALLSYTILKGKLLLSKEDWDLVQQEILNNEYELTTPYHFNDSDNSNVTLAIQFYNKRLKKTMAERNAVKRKEYEYEEEDEDSEKDKSGPSGSGPSGSGPSGKGRLLNATNSGNNNSLIGPNSDYYKFVHFVSKYLSILGMFEVKNNGIYVPYNGINQNGFTWKEYKHSVITNSFGLQEIRIDTSDVTLLGTSDSIRPLPEVANRLQIRFNSSARDKDSFLECRGNSSCTNHQYLNTSKETIYNSLVQYYNRDQDTLNSTQLIKLQEDLDYLQRNYTSQREENFWPYYYEYYANYTIWKSNQIATQMIVLFDTLNNDYSDVSTAYHEALEAAKGDSEDIPPPPPAPPKRRLLYEHHAERRRLQQQFGDNPYSCSTEPGHIEMSYDGLFATFEENNDIFWQNVSDINKNQFRILQAQRFMLEEAEQALFIQQKCLEDAIIEAKDRLDFQLVIYDEAENFRNYDSPLFYYPYQKRKSYITTLYPIFTTGFNVTNNPEGYYYPHERIIFQMSYSCLEGNVLDDLAIWNPLAEKIPEILFGTTAADDDNEYECDNGEPIQKFKYQESSLSTLAYTDDYEIGIINDKILLEIQIGMSSKKTTNVRTTTTALDFFGDLGGFHQSVDFMVFWLGEWFAFKFFLQSIANNLFLRKKLPDEIQDQED